LPLTVAMPRSIKLGRDRGQWLTAQFLDHRPQPLGPLARCRIAALRASFLADATPALASRERVGELV
jgi:hypothetical protein